MYGKLTALYALTIRVAVSVLFPFTSVVPLCTVLNYIAYNLLYLDAHCSLPSP